nr:MAG TPA: hypothetical protein [Bacteriophage sp.]
MVIMLATDFSLIVDIILNSFQVKKFVVIT